MDTSREILLQKENKSSFLYTFNTSDDSPTPTMYPTNCLNSATTN